MIFLIFWQDNIKRFLNTKKNGNVDCIATLLYQHFWRNPEANCQTIAISLANIHLHFSSTISDIYRKQMPCHFSESFGTRISPVSKKYEILTDLAKE